MFGVHALIMVALVGILAAIITLSLRSSEGHQTSPNIIFIYADDLGWNDVSFHGSPEIPTPNIDALALNGIVLNNYYGQTLCTPSRAAFLTGLYPIRLGLQHFIIKAGEASGLPLNVTTLPQHLKRLGYDTHLVGKWHLGYQKKEYTPTYRGYDSFFGYLNARIDYYDHTHLGITELPKQPVYFGRDLNDGHRIINDSVGKYATHVFTEKARSIILNHHASKPLFLHLAHAAPHIGNNYQKLQAPPEIIKKFSYIKDINRRIYAAMVSALDDSVGAIFNALSEKNMLKNSIVMFVSDNGGEVSETQYGYASNYPLRGKKFTLWEGGVRLPAVIWSPLLKIQESRISAQLMHVTDWLPTFYNAAGGDPKDLGDIDGHSMWDALSNNLESPRKDLLYNIDPISGLSSFRMGDLKLVNGTVGYDLWFGPTGFENRGIPTSMHEWVFQNGSSVRDVLVKSGMWVAKNPDEWYKKSTMTCEVPASEYRNNCEPDKKPCLFNITADPCEYLNLANRYPEIVKSMMDAIDDYQKVSMEPQTKPSDPRADPMCHDFAYVPWLDSEYYKECDYAL